MGYEGMAEELNRLGFAAQSLKLILLNPAMAGQWRQQVNIQINPEDKPAVD